jgi:hypothetical protein
MRGCHRPSNWEASQRFQDTRAPIRYAIPSPRMPLSNLKRTARATPLQVAAHAAHRRRLPPAPHDSSRCPPARAASPCPLAVSSLTAPALTLELSLGGARSAARWPAYPLPTAHAQAVVARLRCVRERRRNLGSCFRCGGSALSAGPNAPNPPPRYLSSSSECF